MLCAFGVPLVGCCGLSRTSNLIRANRAPRGHRQCSCWYKISHRKKTQKPLQLKFSTEKKKLFYSDTFVPTRDLSISSYCSCFPSRPLCFMGTLLTLPIQRPSGVQGGNSGLILMRFSSPLTAAPGIPPSLQELPPERACVTRESSGSMSIALHRFSM